MTTATRNVCLAVTDAHSTVMTAIADYREAMRGGHVFAKTVTATALPAVPRRAGFNAGLIGYAPKHGFA